MATLTWADVVVIGVVATIGFTMLSYWVSGWMARHSVSGQVKGKPLRKEPKEPRSVPTETPSQ